MALSLLRGGFNIVHPEEVERDRFLHSPMSRGLTLKVFPEGQAGALQLLKISRRGFLTPPNETVIARSKRSGNPTE